MIAKLFKTKARNLLIQAVISLFFFGTSTQNSSFFSSFPIIKKTQTNEYLQKALLGLLKSKNKQERERETSLT